MFSIESIWYSPNPWRHPIVWLLAPLGALFYLISTFRRMLYRAGIFKQKHPGVPVIIVGNISVGGNGKTPLVVHLVNVLRKQGYRPGVLSRGYGASVKHFPYSVQAEDTASLVGDEPVLLFQNLHCPLVIDPKRPRGADTLIDQHHCDVIICDDGLQHYALTRDVEIVVVDGTRRFGNGLLLPLGPLRETTARLNSVDFVVANGKASCESEYVMHLHPGKLVNLMDSRHTMELESINGPVTALAGIGNPKRFFDLLKSHQVSLTNTLSFIDHHQFSPQDIPKGTVIMTEKDAVKCREFAHNDCWYLPVAAQLEDDFDKQILGRIQLLKETSANGI